MKAMVVASHSEPCVARLIDANLDRAREGLRVVEDWCRFGLERLDLVEPLKHWRQQLGQCHHSHYKQARSTAGDVAAGLAHPAQQQRPQPGQIVAANCARVQEALRVLEEFGRSQDPVLASTAAAIRYGLYDLEVRILEAGVRHDRCQRLAACTLCLITAPGAEMLARVQAALQAGVGLIQYRAKDGHDRERLAEAQALADLCRAHGALFIVNDRIDLALLVDADGVHLGQDDLPTDAARRLIGESRLLGRSTHNLAQLEAAQQDDCDYLGVGPIYATGTKPEKVPQGLLWARQASDHATLPWFAIGGIQADRLPELLDAGVCRVAVVGAIMAAADSGAATETLLKALTPQP
ncbi:MAG: thiamine phosphate synthase [Synechococcus sp.]|nr:thiamine phosphate synthase [Synechococcus sp.]